MNEERLDDEHTNEAFTTSDSSNLTLSQNNATEKIAVAKSNFSKTSETLPQTIADSANCNTDLDSAIGATALSAITDANLDSASARHLSTTSEELQSLYNELNELKSTVAGQNERLLGILREYSDFHELYPNISIQSLPDEVWHSVNADKLPLAAAYALMERKQQCKEQRALESNERNRACSPGKITTSSEDDYTPEEVRSMPQKEIRRHLSKIMQSMKKWK